MDSCVYIDKDLVVCDLPASSKEEVICTLGALMAGKGLVKDSFADAVLAREAIYPTGLTLPSGMSIAIPHTDPEHVYKPSLAVGIMRDGVTFARMDEPTIEVSARVVYLVAVAEAHAHLDMLQKIVGMCQDQALMEQLVGKPDQTEAFALINNKLIGE